MTTAPTARAARTPSAIKRPVFRPLDLGGSRAGVAGVGPAWGEGAWGEGAWGEGAWAAAACDTRVTKSSSTAAVPFDELAWEAAVAKPAAVDDGSTVLVARKLLPATTAYVPT